MKITTTTKLAAAGVLAALGISLMAAPNATESAAPAGGQANAYLAQMRGELSRGKVKLINDVMRLNADESAKFWPIYEEYESELFELGDKRVELIKRFATEQRAGKLSNAEASTLADGYFDFESKRVELTKKYYDEIARELSPVRAAQFTQIEHRVGTVVDLMIAADMPLIRGEKE